MKYIQYLSESVYIYIYPYLSVFSPNAGKCGKNADQNNSEYGHFLRKVTCVGVLTWGMYHIEI